MSQTTTTQARPPQVGQKAPDFSLVSAQVGTFTLGEAAKKGPVVVAFFPGAFTTPCTKEMCNFSDNWTAYEKLGAQVVGVSVDSKHAQKAFAEKSNIKVPMASDFEKKTVQAYGLGWNANWGLTSKRAVFVVGRDMTVKWAWITEDAGVEPPYAEIQKALQGLN